MRPARIPFLVLTLVIGVACSKRVAPADSVEVAAPEPSAEPEVAGVAMPVLDADGILARVRASGKKGVLVNAWATFCGPCRRELPLLENLAPNLRSSGIDVLLVSMDEPEDAAKAAAFLPNLHITLPSVMAERPLGAFKQRMNPRWPGMLPASFLFDTTGRLRYYWGGEAFESELLPVLDAFAQGKSIDGEADFQVAHEGAGP